MHIFLVLFVALMLAHALAPVSAVAQQPRSSAETETFPSSPAAAMSMLRERAGVRFSQYEGWTIAEDTARREIWSFTPEGHPAHPSVVRRTTVERNGRTDIDMNMLCGAGKQDCDALYAQFQALNAQARENLAAEAGPTSSQQPGAGQLSRARETLANLFEAVDAKRFDEAYEMFSPGFRSTVTRAQFKDIYARHMATAPEREAPRATWYKDPPRAPEPGTYAVFELPCRLPGRTACLETVVLHQPPEGDFAVQRYERTMLGREAQ